MMHRSGLRLGASLSTAVALATLAACEADDFRNIVVTPTTSTFVQRNLVADIPLFGAVTVDPSLVNPWGLAFGPSGALWVANDGTGTATFYAQTGATLPGTAAVPSAHAGAPGLP